MADVYFGPFNDPGDTQGHHHWDLAHDSDCHNAAFNVTRTNQTLNILLALRPGPSLANLRNDCNITLYAAACGLLSHISDVESVVGHVIADGDSSAPPADGLLTFVASWDALSATPLVVNPYNSNFDQAWFSNGVQWAVPKFANGVILVATVSGNNLSPTPGTSYTQDPCVAVWVG